MSHFCTRDDSNQQQMHAIELGSNSQSRLAKQKQNRSQAGLETFPNPRTEPTGSKAETTNNNPLEDTCTLAILKVHMNNPRLGKWCGCMLAPRAYQPHVGG